MAKLSDAMIRMLDTVRMWGKGSPSTYMPRVDQERTVSALVVRGLLEYRPSVDFKSYNGYALTEAGLEEWRKHYG